MIKKSILMSSLIFGSCAGIASENPYFNTNILSQITEPYYIQKSMVTENKKAESKNYTKELKDTLAHFSFLDDFFNFYPNRAR